MRRRQLAFNLTTVAATVVVLGVILMVAVQYVGSNEPAPAAQPILSAANPPATGAKSEPITAHAPAGRLPATSTRQFPRLAGVTTDPWHVARWNRALSARVDIVMTFYNWADRRDPGPVLDQSAREGVIPMFTWEPWRSVPVSAGRTALLTPAPGYSNAEIAAGSQDRYIRMFARRVAAHPGPVLIRLSHEFNGNWYPWTQDTAGYVAAWRHIVGVFRSNGARNAQFIWSPNPNLWESTSTWQSRLSPYWPGAAFVDWVGFSLIKFEGSNRPMDAYWERIHLLDAYRKPVMLAETNAAYSQRIEFLSDLRRHLAAAPNVRAVVLSQAPSRGTQADQSLGDLDWQLWRDAAAAKVFGQIVRDGHTGGRRGPESRPAPKGFPLTQAKAYTPRTPLAENRTRP